MRCFDQAPGVSLKIASAIGALTCLVVCFGTPAFPQCEVEGWIYFTPNVASTQVWVEVRDGSTVITSKPVDDIDSDHPFSCPISDPALCAKTLQIVPNV